MFGLGGGGMDVSSAQSQGASSAYINSSGWVVGVGDAAGGTSATSAGFVMPWYGWLSVGLIALAVLKYRVKGKK